MKHIKTIPKIGSYWKHFTGRVVRIIGLDHTHNVVLRVRYSIVKSEDTTIIGDIRTPSLVAFLTFNDPTCYLKEGLNR